MNLLQGKIVASLERIVMMNLSDTPFAEKKF